MKRLIIHIGTGKTGTSSIQNFLNTNRQLLIKEFNCFYPDQCLSKLEHFGETIYAHYPLVNWIKDRNSQNIIEFIKNLNNSSCEMIIISCENFYHHLLSEDIIFLANSFKAFNIEIICYVRRQDLFIESAWKQQVKIGALKTPFNIFLQRHTQSQYLTEVHANYYRMLKVWEMVLGKQAIKVRIFDKSAWLNNNLIDDFLNTCNLDVKKANDILIKATFTNRALPSDLIRLVQKVNALNLINNPNNQQDFVQYLNKLSVFNNPSLLSKADRIAVIKNYQSTNRALFKEFFNRPIPKCFRPASVNGKINNNQIELENIAIRSIVEIWKQANKTTYINKQFFIKKYQKIINLYFKKSKIKQIFTQITDSKKIENFLPIELQLKNIDSSIIRSSTIISGQHLGCYNLLPASIQQIKPSIWLGNGSIEFLKKVTSEIPPANMYEFHNVWLVAHGCIVDTQYQLFDSPHLIAFKGRSGLKAGLNSDLLDISNQKLGQVFLKNKLISRNISEPCVPIAQPGEWVYGHWLIDLLPRVIFAQQLGIKVKYLLTNRMPDYGRKLLNLIGIMDEDIILYNPIEEAILMEKCFFPSHLRWHSAISPLLGMVRDKFSIYQSPCTNRKLFISRGNYNSIQTISNLQKVHDLMRKYGIEIIEPHQYSIEEQIKLFSESSLIIGEYGSGMHNTLFSHPTTKVIVLQSDAELPFIQAGMGSVLGHPTGFVFGKHIEKYDKNIRTKGRSFETSINLIEQAIQESL